MPFCALGWGTATLACAVLPVDLLASGFRHVQLYTTTSFEIPMASVFVRVRVRESVDAQTRQKDVNGAVAHAVGSPAPPVATASSASAPATHDRAAVSVGNGSRAPEDPRTAVAPAAIDTTARRTVKGDAESERGASFAAGQRGACSPSTAYPAESESGEDDDLFGESLV